MGVVETLNSKASGFWMRTYETVIISLRKCTFSGDLFIDLLVRQPDRKKAGNLSWQDSRVPARFVHNGGLGWHFNLQFNVSRAQSRLLLICSKLVFKINWFDPLSDSCDRLYNMRKLWIHSISTDDNCWTKGKEESQKNTQTWIPVPSHQVWSRFQLKKCRQFHQFIRGDLPAPFSF